MIRWEPRFGALLLVGCAGALPVSAFMPATAAGAAGHANLVKQGSFEFPLSGQERVVKPQKRFGPWTAFDAPVAVAKPLAGFATGTGGQNQQFLALKDPMQDNHQPAGMACQTVYLDPAGSYHLHFWSAAATYDDSITVVWQGNPVKTFADAVSVGTTTWYRHRVNLGPAAGVTWGQVCFSAVGDGYPLVDLVVMHAD